MGEQLSLEIGAKLFAYAAMVVAVGCAVVLTLARADPTNEMRPYELSRATIRLARVAGAVGVFALLVRAIGHAGAVAGPANAWSLETLRLVIVESRWGGGWRWQIALAGVVAVIGWRVRPTRGIAVFAVAVAGWCIVTPWLGHGASSLWQRATHALHLGVTGAWLGTVMVLAVCLTGTDVRERIEDAGRVIERFSPWALLSAGVAGVSGGVLAWTYVGSVEALVGTRYGQLLVAKLVSVVAIASCGFVNWQRARRGEVPSARLVRIEAGLAVVALAVTAALTETEHP